MSTSPIIRPEVVFLDVGDTLIRAHPSWAGIYRQGLLEGGLDIAEEDLERALLHETQAGGWWLDEDAVRADRGEVIRPRHAFDARSWRVSATPTCRGEAFRRIEEAFARRSAWYVYPGRAARA